MSFEALNWAKYQKVGNSGAKFVLMTLANFADASGGSCFPKLSHIAETTEQSEKTVSRCLSILEQKGYLTRYRKRLSDGTLSRYNYRLNLPAGIICHDDDLPPPDNLSGGFDQRTICPSPADNLSPPNTSIKQYKKKKEKKSSLASSKRDDFFSEKSKNYDQFYEKVKEEKSNNGFTEIGEITNEEIEKQALKCWNHWKAENEFPKGCEIAKFKGWLIIALENRKTAFNPKKGKRSTKSQNSKNACQGGQIDNFANPIQSWHELMEKRVGHKVFRSWFRPVQYDDKSNTLQAPTRFIRDWLKENYLDDIYKILGNVQIEYLKDKKTA